VSVYKTSLRDEDLIMCRSVLVSTFRRGNS
jgi:hypothetical protein